jgi:hypothetical protein
MELPTSGIRTGDIHGNLAEPMLHMGVTPLAPKDYSKVVDLFADQMDRIESKLDTLLWERENVWYKRLGRWLRGLF